MRLRCDDDDERDDGAVTTRRARVRAHTAEETTPATTQNHSPVPTPRRARVQTTPARVVVGEAGAADVREREAGERRHLIENRSFSGVIFDARRRASACTYRVVGTARV
jgi:hypothetical protein